MRVMTRRTLLRGSLGFAGATAAYAAGFGHHDHSRKLPGHVKIVEFDNTGNRIGAEDVEKVVKTDDEWKRQLSPEQFQVTRRAGTERPFTGKYWNNHEHGLYRCVCCGNALFSSDTKFESGTGWPSFWEPIARENVVTHI